MNVYMILTLFYWGLCPPPLTPPTYGFSIFHFSFFIFYFYFINLLLY